MTATVLERIRNGLIVSVQARAGSALDDPSVLAALAAAAQAGGARGLRAAGGANIRAIRARSTVPIIGIVKREYEGTQPYITPTLREAAEVLEAGAEIVAFDATARPRHDGATIAQLIEAIHAGGALAMADCAAAADGLRALAAGADILATTLCGYTNETSGTELPALELVRAFASPQRFVICEGGIHSPAQVAGAMAAGAQAVVVGTAITNVEWITAAFAAAAGRQTSSPS